MTQRNKPTILFSNGFGIRKDNLGLFTYFAEKLNNLGYQTVQFDYYTYDETTKEVYTIPFSEHAQILQKHINDVSQKEEDIVIIGQSQGSLIPTLCDTNGVIKVIGISPFFLTDRQAVEERYNSRPGSTTNFDSISRRLHSDGKVTVIPPEYWKERFNTNQFELYNSLGERLPLTLIYGDKDSLVPINDLTKITNGKLIKLNGDHDFTGDYKEKLYETILEELTTLK